MTKLPNIVSALFLALFACAVAALAWLWMLRCEGFGCTGLGIAWAMWVGVLYVPTLVLGLLALSRRKALVTWLFRVVRMSLRIHLLLGAGLAVYWLVKMLPRTME